MWILLGTLAFVLEVVAWVALARWGWHSGQTTLRRWLLAVLAPMAFMVFWGVFLSPKARVSLPVAAKLGLQLLVFAVAAGAASQVWGRPFALGLLLLAGVTIVTAQLTGDE